MSAIPDERLALVFTCCHPALAPESRVALTLREVGGLDDPEIARAFLVAEPAMAQRLVRAKRKIRGGGDPVSRAARPPPPRAPALGPRRPLPRVQRGLRGDGRAEPRSRRSLRRGDPARQAARGAHARRVGGARASSPSCSSRTRAEPPASARTASSSCSTTRIARSGIVTGSTKGCACSTARYRCGRPGPYVSSRRRSQPHTPRSRPREEIVGLYDRLAEIDPSPVVLLNRAVAVALAGDVERGLAQIDGLGDLGGYHLLHAARADLLRRLERRNEAADAYREAIALAGNEAERAYLERRLREVS